MYYIICFNVCAELGILHSFPTRRSSDLTAVRVSPSSACNSSRWISPAAPAVSPPVPSSRLPAGHGATALLSDEVDSLVRSEEHTSELQSRLHLVCRLLLEKKKVQPTHTA